jgi:prephenate dehydrogenase
LLHTVGIVGLGLIGGSLAKALRGRVSKIIGVDPEVEAPGLIDAAGPLSECDLVILAAPMDQIPRLVPRIAKQLNRDATLMDVASVKGPVFDAVLDLKRPVNFVSGHPMAGTEHNGFEHSNADLFQGRPFLLIPGAISSKRPIQMAEKLVHAIGARPIWMSTPEEHDLALAYVSHLPHVLAYALVESAAGKESLAGPSFRDATRVAGSLPDTVTAYLWSNRKNVLKALRGFSGTLARFRRILETGKRDELLSALRRLKPRKN